MKTTENQPIKYLWRNPGKDHNYSECNSYSIMANSCNMHTGFKLILKFSVTLSSSRGYNIALNESSHFNALVHANIRVYGNSIMQ